MVGIYLSGTGNFKMYIEKLVSLIHSSAKAIPGKPSGYFSNSTKQKRFYIGSSYTVF